MSQILIVDDDRAFRDHITALLVTAGFLVSTADDGRQALEKIRVESLALIVTGIVMPTMDGLELIRAVRRLHRLDLPIIALSTRERGMDFLAAAASFGANATLGKDRVNDRLLDLVYQHIHPASLQQKPREIDINL